MSVNTTATEMDKLTDFCEDKRHFRPQNNAARERSRVKTLRSAFLDLQRSLPAVPLNTKLSKLDILVLATAYIYHLTETLEDNNQVQWKNRTTFDPRQNITTLIGGNDYEDRSTVGPTGNCVQNKRRLIADTRLTETAPLSVSWRDARNSRIKSLKTSCSSQSSQGRSLVHVNNNSQSQAPRSSNLSPSEMKNSHVRLSGANRSRGHGTVGILHPVKKWPMRSRLYDSIFGREAGPRTLWPSCTTSWSCLVHSRLTSSNHECPQSSVYL